MEVQISLKNLQDNAELNYLETNVRNVIGPAYGNFKSHESWFKEKWDQSEPWTGRFIKEILLKSPIGRKIENDNETGKSNAINIQANGAKIKPDPIVEHIKKNKKGTKRVVKKKPTRLRITMPDGFIIEEQTAAESLRKFVLMIGIDKVRATGLLLDKNLLVSNVIDNRYKSAYKPLGNSL